jgi:adenylate cyclase, class 2
MQTEFEAKYTNIDKNEVRTRLKNAGARLVESEFIQRRNTFYLPSNSELGNGWVRVRDEKNKVTLSIKAVFGKEIQHQKEIMIIVNSFEDTSKLLEILGCRKKSYQETKREIWKLENCEITIDEWPYLEPFLEIEGDSEKVVRDVSTKLGFDFSTAVFGAVDTLYSNKYNIPEDIINNHTPEIKFGGISPFSK